MYKYTGFHVAIEENSTRYDECLNYWVGVILFL